MRSLFGWDRIFDDCRPRLCATALSVCQQNGTGKSGSQADFLSISCLWLFFVLGICEELILFTTVKPVRYVCCGKTRKQTECDRQTGYTAHILYGIIDKLVRQIFERMKAIFKSVAA